MGNMRLRFRQVAVLLLQLGVMALPVAGLPQAATGAAAPGAASVSCPQGTVLIPSRASALARSGKPLKAFCIDVFEYPNVLGGMPNYDVTWVEAEALCMKEGKRLCTPGEWRAACSGTHGFLYPYGATYQPAACNTESEWTMNGSNAVLSGAFPACVNDYGVFDMSGNVSEWTASDGEVATINGGSFVSGRFSSCRSFYTLSKTERYVFNGVRCCAQPIAAETGSRP